MQSHRSMSSPSLARLDAVSRAHYHALLLNMMVCIYCCTTIISEVACHMTSAHEFLSSLRREGELKLMAMLDKIEKESCNKKQCIILDDVRVCHALY